MTARGRARARGPAEPDELADDPVAPALALAPEAAQRLLEELLYERVLTVVRLFELRGLERELEARIDTLWAAAGLDGADGGDGDGPDGGGDGPGDPPPRVVAAALIDRAWKRVEATWQRERAADPPGGLRPAGPRGVPP